LAETGKKNGVERGAKVAGFKHVKKKRAFDHMIEDPLS
jgi:hypothetical protein